MYLISNRQRREAMDFIAAFIRLTAGSVQARERDKRRRAGLLLEQLSRAEETPGGLVRALREAQAEAVAEEQGGTGDATE